MLNYEGLQLILKWSLPVYFVVYFATAMVWKSVVVTRQTGVNPFVLPKDDTAHGLVGRYFKRCSSGRQ